MAKFFVISAPSGAGKTTLVHTLIERYGQQYRIEKAVTYTSRVPRQGEQEGLDYHFVSQAEFMDRVAQGFFLEWIAAYGAHYGLPRTVLDRLSQGYSQLIILERQGAERIKQQFSESILIWLETSSLQVVRNRLQDRGTENQKEIENRLNLAFSEIEAEKTYPLYTYHLISDLLESSIEMLRNIVSAELSVENGVHIFEKNNLQKTSFLKIF